ncbi:glutamate--tRNA ligase [Acidithiobacillus sp. CV18-2]|uniref:Glutamate--tRNA ligase n=1 Tax=Igneacidithiobacillus copahuensis TaxID=2724909 RepID=A0AAE2YMK5_9PROT|nr:glutamate--tRNA ligase [Igneacidithiobacillus copahuensis]MBU2753930.1 glutamate--tRNA ligase [Acidithiobacillus sp. CV18-3]MBU2756158.1 glutamate--tRNA ligase [Acidithiobacillus sp. BN09-2]MBU2778603.1 glutamate--tRNA ligase [Acidithiobacillus sp. CV18-2]MBU2797170.1 glutamate--tRNA ligase [Acidithiobacillus sp. VAN18-2]MBU2798941.1 glutamate--tRNA ligase [Acidithiobacillus sp. VAN18-4]UTV81481.1 glutamate--tRNA ligase [Acidithiobacillus sp. YTS05]
MTVRTRFAPSPTGYLHIGGVRTALFSWLHARQQQGQFILRIEDTDLERSTPEATAAILEGMQWLGLDWDEGPFYQTQRMERYREVLAQMLAAGTAYHCYCSKEELDLMREEQRTRGEKPRYDGRCRQRPEARPGVSPVIRFRSPDSGETVVEDLVHGRVVFQNSELDDLIIARSDGTPTYNFCVVVDDWDMGITQVIRGDDHLNNTPRQMQILQALGASVPQYAHVPMILGPDKQKLSKRHGAVSVLEYREQGFLPDALLNFLVRLGWSHGDQEVFSRAEMIEHFRIGEVHKAASAFNPEKLLWLNAQHLQTLSAEELARQLRPYLVGLDDAAIAAGPAVEKVVPLLQERAKTLVDMAAAAKMFYVAPETAEEKDRSKHLAGQGALLQAAWHALEQVTDWTAGAVHTVLQALAQEHAEGKLGKVAQPLRVAVAGCAVSPPLDQTLAVLGREETLRRLRRAQDWV